MPIPVGDDVIEITLHFRYDDQHLMNVFHYHASPGTIPQTLAGANALAQAVWNQMSVNVPFRTTFNAQCSFSYVSAQIIKPTRWARGRSNNTAGVPGLRPGVPLPASTQLSFTAQSDVAGPGGHGGCRIAGAVSIDLDRSRWLAAYQNDILAGWQTAYDIAPFAQAGLTPIIFKRARYLDSNEVVSTLVEDEARTMRRRVVGRGI